MNRTSGLTSKPLHQSVLLDLIQQGETCVYAAVTREGAIKIGVTSNLMQRKSGIKFGGVRHYLGFRPGDYAAEQALHATLAEHRIPGTKEYYYPVPELLPAINALRSWLDVPAVRRRDLPRIARCTFHRRVMESEASKSAAV